MEVSLLNPLPPVPHQLGLAYAQPPPGKGTSHTTSGQPVAPTTTTTTTSTSDGLRRSSRLKKRKTPLSESQPSPAGPNHPATKSRKKRRNQSVHRGRPQRSNPQRPRDLDMADLNRAVDLASGAAQNGSQAPGALHYFSNMGPGLTSFSNHHVFGATTTMSGFPQMPTVPRRKSRTDSTDSTGGPTLRSAATGTSTSIHRCVGECHSKPHR